MDHLSLSDASEYEGYVDEDHELLAQLIENALELLERVRRLMDIC
ncbi:hypothetical protein [Pseudomonas mediterranea]|jgi:PHD/YefM family antitoxin component YafN of YafNO toxin-antitoxin module|nr:hypothetical protein [Pseudomonas mediterranea]MDU9029765.1 hypothetical protein [Pseudomonas mediterranea]UZE00687.1 hypothetical protein LOY71_24860 [Pseudomonas mediterranea]